MKKFLVVLTAIAIIVGCFAGCSPKAKEADNKVSLKDNGDGTLTCVDTQNSPLDGGLSITVDKNDGFVNFQITDGEGNETVEFYKFTPADTTCHRYRYVSIMGTGFNYYYDYSAEELKKIEDKDGKDKTQSTKESGRFDGAQTETKEAVDKLIQYFSDTFSISIEEVVK
jgi:hypothetical protein